jgi:hypothetical protein
MNGELENLTSELQKITSDVKSKFGSLSAGQINWKPSAEAWSVGQCFEHLIKTNALFYPTLEKIERGEYKNSFLENYSPLSGFFGNLLVKSLQKDERKFKAPFMKLMTYKLADGFRVVVQHEKRHVRQAERVMQAAGFPK